MKKSGHPRYRQILFVDTATGTKFICGSSVQTKEEETVDGVVYPVYRLSISAASHPLFTGEKRLLDAEGRVDKFKRRYSIKTSTPFPAASATGLEVAAVAAAPAPAHAPAASPASAKVQAVKQAKAGAAAAATKAPAKPAAKASAPAAKAPAGKPKK